MNTDVPARPSAVEPAGPVASSAMSSPADRAKQEYPAMILAALGSYGLAATLFLFLALLTFFGTLEQVDTGLFEVQKKYFESLFLVHWMFGWLPVPLPGVYLLLILLLINLMVGGVVRIRKNKRTLGVLIAHLGIVLMLAAGFVKMYFSDDGQITLVEGQSSSEFYSYYEWEVSITEAKSGASTWREWAIDGQDFVHRPAGSVTRFTHPELPFDVALSGFQKHCEIRPTPGDDVGGFVIQSLPPRKEAEQNLAGLRIEILDKNGGANVEDFLWGYSTKPLVHRADGRTWAIALHHKRFPLPFEVRLDKFTRELHPRTNTASSFASDITKIENRAQQSIHISMNEPLRHGGYTFFQASWGPENARPGDRLFSVLAVVDNPSDHWPLYSCIIIAVGLLLHFAQKLYRHLRAEAAARHGANP